MTPIKFIAWYKASVYVVDDAGFVQFICTADSEERADWIAWSLARTHGVEHKKLAAVPLMRMEV